MINHYRDKFIIYYHDKGSATSASLSEYKDVFTSKTTGEAEQLAGVITPKSFPACTVSQDLDVNITSLYKFCPLNGRVPELPLNKHKYAYYN